MKKSLVFTVARASVGFEAVLSSGEKTELIYFEPNFNQLATLTESAGVKESLEATLGLLEGNLEGEKKEEFISDLKNNGNVQDFFEAINEALSEAKKEKRKNSSSGQGKGA